MIKCPSCNAELAFSVKLQQVTCEYCLTKFNPRELINNPKYAEENTYEGTNYLCSQCGASLLTFDETAITFCSYCGSQAMIKSRMERRNNPDFIIPFKKTKEECISNYKSKVNKSLFAPKYMKFDIVVNKFRGIYIPYCIYKYSFHGEDTQKGKKFSHRSGDYLYYNDYDIVSNIDADYDGISYDMLSNFYDKFSHSIPHNFKEAEHFNPNYLTGFYADAVDVDSVLYEEIGENIVLNDSTKYLLARKEFHKYGCLSPKLDFKITDKRIGMFPVYFLAIRDKNNTYVNYAVINGQTGKVVADLPVDFKKYILISTLLAIPIFLLINNFLVIVPKNICIFSIVASIISMSISMYQLKKIYERENHLDDIGHKKKTQNIQQEKKSLSNIKKILLAFLMGLISFIFIEFLYIKNLSDIEKTIAFLQIFNFILYIFVPAIIIFNIFSKKHAKNTLAINENKVKVPFKLKFKYSYKQWFAIILGLIVIICDFVNDIYYYGSSMIMFGLVIWSFFDLIKSHNLLVSTKLPQLEVRGGDENE